MFLKSFTYEDCWVLLSISSGDKGSQLSGIITSGDILNAAVFTKKELVEGLNKLFNNGYIIFSEDRFFWTEKAKIFYKVNEKYNEGCISQLFRLAEILKKQPFKKGNINTIVITDEEYNSAVDKYLGKYRII